LGGDFLASPLLAIKSEHELSKKGKMHIKNSNFKVFLENIEFLSVIIYDTYISKILKKTLNKGINLGVA
jgi:hypothetical protein